MCILNVFIRVHFFESQYGSRPFDGLEFGLRIINQHPLGLIDNYYNAEGGALVHKGAVETGSGLRVSFVGHFRASPGFYRGTLFPFSLFKSCDFNEVALNNLQEVGGVARITDNKHCIHL